jgi:hypothetical protein
MNSWVGKNGEQRAGPYREAGGYQCATVATVAYAKRGSRLDPTIILLSFKVFSPAAFSKANPETASSDDKPAGCCTFTAPASPYSLLQHYSQSYPTTTSMASLAHKARLWLRAQWARRQRHTAAAAGSSATSARPTTLPCAPFVQVPSFYSSPSRMR